MSDNLSTEKMLSALEEALSGAPPAKHTPEMSALEALKATKDRTQEGVQRIERLERTIPSVMRFKDELGTLNEVELEDDSDAEGLTWREVGMALAGLLGYCLASDNLALRRAVALPMLRHMIVNRKTDNPKVANGVLIWAGNRGFLVSTETGALKLSDEYGFTDDDKKKIAPLLRAMVEKLPKKIGADVPAATNGKPEAPERPAPKRITDRDITVAEVCSGCPGELNLYVPPQNGEDKGFTLRLDVTEDRNLVLVKGSNGLTHLANRGLCLSAFVDERGELRQGLRATPPGHLSEEERNDWMNDMGYFGVSVLRGLKAAITASDSESPRDLEPAEFLNGQIGDSVITYEDFEWEPHWDEDAWQYFEELALRFRRRDDGRIGLTEVLTEDAEELFGDFVGVFYEPEDKTRKPFSGVKPLVVRNFLRASIGRFARPSGRHTS